MLEQHTSGDADYDTACGVESDRRAENSTTRACSRSKTSFRALFRRHFATVVACGLLAFFNDLGSRVRRFLVRLRFPVCPRSLVVFDEDIAFCGDHRHMSIVMDKLIFGRGIAD